MLPRDKTLPSMTHTGTKRAQFLIAALALLLFSGCAKLLSTIMVSAPNKLNPFRADSHSPPARWAMGLDRQFRVDVGPPEASLLVSVVEPEDQPQPRGTILVVHGIWNEGAWMLSTARMLADAGYRAVLIDLRGHGNSTGEFLTYGVRESRDLSQVIDALQERNLVAGKLGVYGISYGATTSIHLAGIDPRIEAVVAVAPFSKMRDVVPDFARTLLPGVERMISDETFQEAVNLAGEDAQFDPDLADAVAAIKKTEAPVLIMHGDADWLVPSHHGLRLHEAAPDHSEFVRVPDTGHFRIWYDPDGDVAEKTREWFDRWLLKPEHAE